MVSTITYNLRPLPRLPLTTFMQLPRGVQSLAMLDPPQQVMLLFAFHCMEIGCKNEIAYKGLVRALPVGHVCRNLQTLK